MVSAVNSLIVKELASKYSDVRNCMVINYQGISALEANELRKDLRARKIRLEIVKNSLARRAFEEVGGGEFVQLLTGPSAIVSGGDDPAVLARVLVGWSKKLPTLKIRGGLAEGRLVSSPQVENLSKLPPRPVLLAQMATLLVSPMSRLAVVMNAPLRNLHGALLAFKEKKTKESPSQTGG